MVKSNPLRQVHCRRSCAGNNIIFPALQSCYEIFYTLCFISCIGALFFIHTKLRNRLSDENVVKSVYVYANRKNLVAHEDTEEEEDTQGN